MRRSRVSVLGLVSVLFLGACAAEPRARRPSPGVEETGGTTGSGGGGQPGTGGKGGASPVGTGGTGGQGTGGRAAEAGSGGGGGTGGAAGTGGASRDAGGDSSVDASLPASDARSDLSSSSDLDGTLARLDAFCTPKVILMIDPGAGGMRFMTALGGTNDAVTATVQQMGREICRYLYRAAEEVRPANELELIVDASYTGIAAKSGNVGKVRVRFGASYLANYQGDVAREVKGILYHEMTHIYQNDDKPEGLGAGGWPYLAEYYESHADAVRTHFGHSSCGAPNKTGTWDRGAYCARAHWWLFLENRYPDFLYRLNLQMKGGDNMVWTPARGATIVNKPFETLWEEYKAAACCAGSDRSCCK